MAFAGLALPADWGGITAAFSIGLLWRPAPPPVHLHCLGVGEPAERDEAPASRSVPDVLLAFVVGVALGRLWNALRAKLHSAILRLRRPRALFEH